MEYQRYINADDLLFISLYRSISLPFKRQNNDEMSREREKKKRFANTVNMRNKCAPYVVYYVRKIVNFSDDLAMQ